MGTPLPRGVSAGRGGPPPAHAPPGGSAPAEGALPTPPTKGTLKLQPVQRPDTCRPPSPTRTAGAGAGGPLPLLPAPLGGAGAARPPCRRPERGRTRPRERTLSPRCGSYPATAPSPGTERQTRWVPGPARWPGGRLRRGWTRGGSGDAEGGSRSLTRHSPTPHTQNPEHRWPGPNTRWPRGAARPAPGRPDRCRPGSDAVPTRSAEGAVSAPPTGAKANGP